MAGARSTRGAAKRSKQEAEEDIPSDKGENETTEKSTGDYYISCTQFAPFNGFLLALSNRRRAALRALQNSDVVINGRISPTLIKVAHSDQCRIWASTCQHMLSFILAIQYFRTILCCC